jgi:AAA domain-containing protein
MSNGDLAAVLLTGPFGVGKSAVAAEMADALEHRAARYAMLDLDYFAWGYPGGDDDGAEFRMMLRNLEPVLANYLAAGVDRVILARTIHAASELERLRAALPMPLRVVRLSVPWTEIERRLSADVTSGRADDLRRAAEQVESSPTDGAEDLVVSNDRPVQEVAGEILAWLAWTSTL